MRYHVVAPCSYTVATCCMVVLEMIISDMVMRQEDLAGCESHGVKGKIVAAVNVAM